MTAALQLESATLPCPKTGCAGRVRVVNTWPAKRENFLNVQLQCPICKLRDFQNFPIPKAHFGEQLQPFEFGSVVKHPIHGQGMVVNSGPNFTRVCFRGMKGREQECFTVDLKLDESAEDLNAYRATLDAVAKLKGSGVRTTTCPRCEEQAGLLTEIGGEYLCIRCTSEIKAGKIQHLKPDGTPRWLNEFYDPKTPPSLPPGNADDRPGIFATGCELCHTTGVTLRYTEKLWVCKACREVMDIGDRIVRGSE